jgi:pyruvate/2-oxoglutarate dehydrogenase complex dihydrolipoamide dehydrogenase (E3) component
VVLAEPRDAFVHNVAAIRAIVAPALLDRLIIPYDRLLGRGTVVQDRAVGLGERDVKLAARGALEADIIVVATGSRSARPFKPTGDSVAEFRAASAEAHEMLSAATSVAGVGGGAVGIELAGEIAAGTAGKRVALFSGAPSLVPNMPQGLGKRLLAQLRKMGVAVHLGASAEGLLDANGPRPGPLQLSTGLSVAANIVFPAIGITPVTTLLDSFPGVSFDPSGRVSVDPWLRPAGRPNMFALGDMAATGEPMTIVSISAQVPWLARTITALFDGKQLKELPPYVPSSPRLFLVPLGPRRDASVLPVSGRPVVVDTFLTSVAKGKDLLNSRYRIELGYQ